MYFGIDVGGTRIRIGAFTPKGDELIDAVSFKVSNFDESIAKIIEDIKKLSKGEKILGIGIGLPGQINIEEGYLEKTPNLKTWEKKSITKILAKTFNTTVKIDHDVAIAALGESLTGNGKNIDKFIYLSWGTGFGGAVVEKILEKIKISPFEPGHQILEWNGILCNCGQWGCLEAYIGGRAFEKYYGKKLEDLKDEKIWETLAEKATQGTINTLVHHPSKLIIFGGGVAYRQPHLIERIKIILKKRNIFLPMPDIKIAKNKEMGALYGAAGLFFIT